MKSTITIKVKLALWRNKTLPVTCKSPITLNDRNRPLFPRGGDWEIMKVNKLLELNWTTALAKLTLRQNKPRSMKSTSPCYSSRSKHVTLYKRWGLGNTNVKKNPINLTQVFKSFNKRNTKCSKSAQVWHECPKEIRHTVRKWNACNVCLDILTATPPQKSWLSS